MNNHLQLIFSRRSIRKYHDIPVAKEHTEAILRAAMAAPSASNKQPWQFVVIEERRTLDALAELHPYGKMLFQATQCIVVCGDKANPYWEQDCSAATQNILLAATALGLGSVWLGVHPRADRAAQVASVLGISEEYIPLCLIAIGHPAEEKPPADRYDESKVHWEKWKAEN
jgi:nitroreductase